MTDSEWVFVLEQSPHGHVERYVFGPYPDELTARAAVDSAPVRAMVDRGNVEVGWVVVELRHP